MESLDNAVLYHIGLNRDLIENAQYVILPGDPGRVEELAKAIGKNAKFIASHREYTSWLTYVCEKPVLVMSTGMGGPSVAIGVEELAQLGVKNFIRVGTTGSIREDLNIGDVVINKASVRLEGTSSHFAPIEFPATADLDITLALRQAARELKIPHKVGINVSSDTFWPGQERYDCFSNYVLRRFQGSLKEWQKLGVTNFEMESATLFTIANVFGLRAGAINGVIAKRTESETVASRDMYKVAEKNFQAVTKKALEILISEEIHK
ncbi:MAG: uridine phosphorylase [Synergistaceae bacterium]|nr:uridine phosphorylase [Synergistaceae bacterium]